MLRELTLKETHFVAGGYDPNGLISGFSRPNNNPLLPPGSEGFGALDAGKGGKTPGPGGGKEKPTLLEIIGLKVDIKAEGSGTWTSAKDGKDKVEGKVAVEIKNK
jgi:hypothetical protein